MTNEATETLTITENQTSTMPSDSNQITCSLGAIKSRNGLFMLLETILGITVVGILLRGTDVEYPMDAIKAMLAFYVCIVTSAFRSLVLFMAYLMSPRAADDLPKTSFEFLHNLVAFLLCAPSSFSLVILFGIAHHEDPKFHAEIVITVLGIVSSVLYCLGSIYSYKSFKSS